MSLIRSMSICLTMAASLGAQTAARATDETAIREIVDRYVAARDHSDAKGIAALFTGDADQLVSSGEWRKGLDEVVRGTMASSQNESGKRTIKIESVRFVGRDVAIADGRYEISGQAGAAARRMWTTLVMQQTPAGWRIAAIRNMLPAAPAPAAAK